MRGVWSRVECAGARRHSPNRRSWMRRGCATAIQRASGRHTRRGARKQENDATTAATINMQGGRWRGRLWVRMMPSVRSLLPTPFSLSPAPSPAPRLAFHRLPSCCALLPPFEFVQQIQTLSSTELFSERMRFEFQRTRVSCAVVVCVLSADLCSPRCIQRASTMMISSGYVIEKQNRACMGRNNKASQKQCDRSLALRLTAAPAECEAAQGTDASVGRRRIAVPSVADALRP